MQTVQPEPDFDKKYYENWCDNNNNNKKTFDTLNGIKNDNKIVHETNNNRKKHIYTPSNNVKDQLTENLHNRLLEH